MPRRHLATTAAAVLSLTLLAACGGDEDEAATPAADDTTPTEETTQTDEAAAPAEVTIEQSRFEPDELTVPAGTEVTFTNLDLATHTVTSAEGSPLEFDSGDMGKDDEFRQTFAEPGTYDYFCEVHPTMRSTVVVE